MNYEPDILINIFHDTKNQKTYLMNVTSKKLYTYPDDLKKLNIWGGISAVAGTFFLIFPLYDNPWYINNPSKGLIVMLLLLCLFGSILIGVGMFWITRKLLNRYALTEREYLELQPELRVVRDIIEEDKVIGRVLLKSKAATTANMLFAIGAIVCFILFYRTYILNYLFIAVALIILTSDIFSNLKKTLFVVKLVQERKAKKE